MSSMVPLATARLVTLGLFVAIVSAIWLWPVFEQTDCQCLTVVFLDVGQGDAVYIRTFDGVEMLVDGGKDRAVLPQLRTHQSFFDRELDVVVATHPDLDHIGGLIDVLARYRVNAIVLTENQNDTPTADAFLTSVRAENTQVLLANAGQSFMLGASTTVTIYSPTGDATDWESNNASIVLKVTYGETEVLLTGDASAGIEEYLVETYGNELGADILKLGHHGSKTSTSELFLDTVQPRYAVVSAGVGNRYNHPHQEVMERVFARNIRSFHTGIDSPVVFESDGSTILVK